MGKAWLSLSSERHWNGSRATVISIRKNRYVKLNRRTFHLGWKESGLAMLVYVASFGVWLLLVDLA